MLGNFEILVLSGLFVAAGLAIMLHLQFGLTGIVNFGIVGFWGLGIYGVGVLTVEYDVPLLLAIPIVTVITGVVAFVLGWFILELDGQAVLVSTLAFATIVFQLVENATGITKGAIGLGTVQYPIRIDRDSELFAAGITHQLVYMIFLAVVVIALAWYARRLRGQPFGRLMVAISGNERLARSLGKPTFRHKLVVFTVTSAMMATLGGLQGPVQQFLTPALVLPTLTFTVWIGLILGGKNHWAGGVLGVVILGVIFKIVIDSLDLPREWTKFMQQFEFVLYGALLVILIMLRPQGLLGDYRPKSPKIDDPPKAESTS